MPLANLKIYTPGISSRGELRTDTELPADQEGTESTPSRLQKSAKSSSALAASSKAMSFGISEVDSIRESINRGPLPASPLSLEVTAPTAFYTPNVIDDCGIQGCDASFHGGSNERLLARMAHQREAHPELLGHAPSPASSSGDVDQGDDPGKAPPSP